MQHARILLVFVLVAAGSCAERRAPLESRIDLTLVTWNILHGANEEGVLDLPAQGAYLRELDADLVFLQEIDERCERSGGVDQMATLGQTTGLDPAFGAFMPYQGGRYGLGMLSALPVVATRSLSLPEGDEPRVALLREVELLGARLLAVDVHFNWTDDDTSRFAQARALLAEIGSEENAIVIAGDFNDHPGSRTMKAFYDAGFRHLESPGPSWNSSRPSADIDHILFRGGRWLELEPLGGAVLADTGLSDHRPVRGALRVRARR